MPDDEIFNICVNGVADNAPFPLIKGMVHEAYKNAATIGSKRFLLTIKILPSHYAEAEDSQIVIDFVRAQYVQKYPKLEFQNWAYICRSFNGLNRNILIFSLIKEGRLIGVPALKGFTEGIYDDSMMKEC